MGICLSNNRTIDKTISYIDRINGMLLQATEVHGLRGVS